MVQRPKYKTYNIYFSEENIGQKLHDIAFGSDFLTMTPKAQATKVNSRQLGFMKMLNYFYLYIKRHYSQSKKAAYRFRKNICKLYI